MKSSLRLIHRKMKSHYPQLLGIMMLLTIGVAFFITLFSIALQYEKTAEQFFVDHTYADVTFYGTFDNENVRDISELNGTLLVKGRTVIDFREKEQVFRIVSLTDEINTPYLYDGEMPQKKTEGVILKRNAEAMGISIGDTIRISDKDVTITGFVASPEYVYMVQNERITMASPDNFAVVFVMNDFFPQEQGYNEIVALTNSNFDDGEATNVIGAFRAITSTSQVNYTFFRDDLSVQQTFAYVFPIVFALLIATVIYVMLSRSIQQDRKQIGTMKALGISDKKIIGIYLSQFGLTALLGAILGGILSIFIGDAILDILTGGLFEVPTLDFVIYPYLWFVAIVVSVLLCAFSALIALVSTLSLFPSHAMRPRQPKRKKRVFLEKFGFLLNHLSFNTRYALKSSLRNKGRFFAVVLGMCGTTALLTFSLGFSNSIINTQDRYFDDFANYDVIINFEPSLTEFEHPALEQIADSHSALILPFNKQGETYTLVVVENDFDMFNLPNSELEDGIVIPEFFADKWGVQIGDYIEIENYYIDRHLVVISAIIPQHLGLMLFTSSDYIHSITSPDTELYNAIFGRSQNMEELQTYLIENDIDFTTIDDDKTTFDSVMEIMSVMTWLLIMFSIVLGFTVLYSVGLINLSAREYEYMFMGVMGYPQKSIISAHVKEAIVQLALAIPLGFLLGYLLLENIRGAFSSSSFVISAVIFPQTYLISALSVIGVTAIMTLFTSRHIEKLDIVGGLKSQDG